MHEVVFKKKKKKKKNLNAWQHSHRTFASPTGRCFSLQEEVDETSRNDKNKKQKWNTV